MELHNFRESLHHSLHLKRKYLNHN